MKPVVLGARLVHSGMLRDLWLPCAAARHGDTGVSGREWICGDACFALRTPGAELCCCPEHTPGGGPKPQPESSPPNRGAPAAAPAGEQRCSAPLAWCVPCFYYPVASGVAVSTHITSAIQ